MRLSEAVDRLQKAGVESAKYDAEQLYISLGGFSVGDCKLSDPECNKAELISALERRCKREPLQYILGFTFFYRERYKVNHTCLIPRGDTEILVDYAAENIPSGESILDLCTGSGCVGISTVKNTDKTTATLVDISEDALAIAKENAEANGVGDRVKFLCADVLSLEPKEKYFAILSNPPYVTPSEYEGLEREIFYEPKIAFLGGDDGMDFYKGIISSYKDSLKIGGFMAFEIGCSQGDKIRALGESHGFSVKVLKDLSGNDRVAVLT